MCESNAVCVALAPDVFDLDEDGIAVPLVAELDESQEDPTRMAVDGCPRAAVFVRR
ncbi:ferredoxin [Mycolicibacterium madagascariense]|uniref:ferredoxin n=1 Tax=Mycolicibacterium madagascariense TaxID=212765 RepID=UPI001FE66C37|nr:ferredoxin [Mycolicibacterium madagascariense]